MTNLPTPLAPGTGDFLASCASAKAGSDTDGTDSWCWSRGTQPGGSQGDATGVGSHCLSALCWQLQHCMLMAEMSCARSRGPFGVLAGTVAREGRGCAVPGRAMLSYFVHTILSRDSTGKGTSVRGARTRCGRACEAGGNCGADRGVRQGTQPCQGA